MTVAPIRWGSIQQGQQVFNLANSIHNGTSARTADIWKTALFHCEMRAVCCPPSLCTWQLVG